MLEIQQVNPDGDVVEIRAENARFSDAVTSANIEFSHALEAGGPGRAVGMKPAVDGSMASQGLARQAISADPGKAKYAKDGVAYTSPSGNISTTLGMQGDTIDVDFTATSNNIDLSVTGDVSGMKADGRVTVDPEAEDPDPTVIINFEDISANVTGKLSVDGAKGDQEILPGAVVVFPSSNTRPDQRPVLGSMWIHREFPSALGGPSWPRPRSLGPTATKSLATSQSTPMTGSSVHAQRRAAPS